jgi:hypothetical protein
MQKKMRVCVPMYRSAYGYWDKGDTTVTTLTPAQIATVAKTAGFSGQNLVIAIAICLAESGGVVEIVSAPNTDGTLDRGLWQINTIHSEYSTPDMLIASKNAAAAYTLSSQGTVFTPWSTYNSGKYKQFMSAAQGAVGGAGGGGGTGTGPKPWYAYPRIDGLGGPEPYGPYPKPDSNIQVPADYLVTALLAGVVTDIDHGSPWSCVVTVRLNTALNSLATHCAYIHLRADVAVRIGQQLAVGTTIGYNGFAHAEGSEKAPLGFALYNGDSYGKGAAWALMTKTNLQGPLSPVSLLDAAATAWGLGDGGTLPGGGGGTGTGVSPIPFLEQTHQTLIATPGFYGIALALDEMEQFVGWVDLTVKQPDYTVPIPLTSASFDTGVAPPDVIGSIRSVFATLSMNFYPFAFRTVIFSLGLFLLIALIAKPVSQAGGQIGQTIAANPEILEAFA